MTVPISLPLRSLITTGVPTVTGLPLISVMLSFSPSMSVSLARMSKVTGLSLGMLATSSTATGASFKPVTLMLKVVLAVSPPGSVTV